MEMDENKAEEKKVSASNGKYKSLKRAFTEVSNALRESFKKSIIRESVHWLELKVLIEYDAAVWFQKSEAEVKTFLGMGDTEKMGSEWGKGKSALFSLDWDSMYAVFFIFESWG